MGVVKNLMVRVGADTSGVAKGMKSASSATSQARDSIRKSTTNIKQAVNNGFGGAGGAIRQYAQTVKRTKQAHREAQQNATLLRDKVGNLKSVYETVKSATAGLDLSKPLIEQRAEAEKTLLEIAHKSRQIEKQLAGGTKAKRTAALQEELKQLAQKSRMAEARLASLDRIAEAVGNENMGHASAAGLEQLKQQINQTENQLKVAEMQVKQTKNHFKGLGTAAAQAAGAGISKLLAGLKAVGAAAAQAMANGIRKLGNGLKSLGGAAMRGIASIPGKLLSIGKSASSGAGGVGKLVRQIRNIGVVSLGLRVAGGMFGRLRSIISSYISTNEELHAATAAMTQQLGQALEPAIRLVMAAMQQLMPVVQKVSTAINAVLKSIIGDIGDVQYAMNSLGTYGFDQITKADGQEETGSQVEQEQSKLVQKLTGWISELKNAFVSGDWDGLGKLVGESVNKAFGELNNLDVGEKLGTFANNLTTTLHSIFATIDFANIGQTAATLLGDGVANVDWNKVGETIGLVMTALPTVAVSFVQNTDWQTVGQSALTMLQSAMGVVTEWVQGEDWLKLGQSIRNFVEQTDWAAVPNRMMELLDTAFGGVNFVSIGDMVAQGFNWVIGGLNRVLTEFDWPGLTSTLTEEINNVINGLDWTGFGQTVSELLRTTLQTLSATVTIFDWEGFGGSIADCIDGLDWDGMIGDLSKSVSDILDGGLDLLLGFVQKLDWPKLGTDLWNSMIALVSGVDWGGLLSKALELLGSALGGWASSVVTFWASVATTLSQAFTSAWTYFEGFIDEAGGDVGKGILDGILNGFKNIGSWIVDNLWEPFKEGFEECFGGTGDALGDIFEDVPGKLKKPLNGIIKPINSMLSAMVAGINGLIRALNAIKVDIPNWGIFGELAGKSFGFNLKEISAPQIPELARGGIVDGPTQLIAGEKGKEAIVPLENNTEWIDKVADKISTRQVGGGTGQPMIIQVFLGKRKLTEYVIQDINQITKSTGVCPIKV